MSYRYKPRKSKYKKLTKEQREEAQKNRIEISDDDEKQETINPLTDEESRIFQLSIPTEPLPQSLLDKILTVIMEFMMPPKVYLFHTETWDYINQPYMNPKFNEKYARKRKLQNYNYLLLLMCDTVHFTLCIIDIINVVMYYVNSLKIQIDPSNTFDQITRQITDFLAKLKLIKSNSKMFQNIILNIPVQKYKVSCGWSILFVIYKMNLIFSEHGDNYNNNNILNDETFNDKNQHTIIYKFSRILYQMRYPTHKKLQYYKQEKYNLMNNAMKDWVQINCRGKIIKLPKDETTNVYAILKSFQHDIYHTTESVQQFENWLNQCLVNHILYPIERTKQQCIFNIAKNKNKETDWCKLVGIEHLTRFIIKIRHFGTFDNDNDFIEFMEALYKHLNICWEKFNNSQNNYYAMQFKFPKYYISNQQESLEDTMDKISIQ